MAGKKLLVADDSLTIQKVIRLALSNEGYEIQAISDGADAIQHISTFRPDAILIDVSLPTRSAFEIKREINKMGDLASIRFVLMSSAFEKIDEAQAEEVGFDGNLTKPFDPAHLRQILTDVLAAPPNMPSLAKPEPSSAGIQLDPPMDFPPSDFEMIEPTRVQLQIPPAREREPVREPILENDELWGKHEEFPPALPSQSSPPSPPAPPSEPHSEPQSEHDEIRELTESTIRMSGLANMSEIEKADFEWKVNEPSLKPPSSLADTGESGFQMAPPSYPRESEPAAPDFTDAPPPLPVSEMPEIPDFPDSLPSGMKSASVGGMSRKIEDEVRRQVQETLQSTLEKMARQILPEVAERVIKAEISRLLNEKI